MSYDRDGFAQPSPLGDRQEPLTPAESERELSRLVSAITTAQFDLARFRKQRAVAYLAYRKAKTRAAHHPSCPKVARNVATVAEREEWINNQIWDEFEALTKADTMQEIGIEGLRATLALAEVIRSLNASVRAAFGMSGHLRENQ